MRVDFYRARIVDGLGHIVHERLFAVQIDTDGTLSHSPDLRFLGIFSQPSFRLCPGTNRFPGALSMAP